MLIKDSQFQELLLSFSQETGIKERKQIEEQIWKKYSTENTVLVLVMSSFRYQTEKIIFLKSQLHFEFFAGIFRAQ